MNKLKNHFGAIFNNKVDALGLSVFRILYSIVLFCETLQLFRFRHVIYDKEPFGYIGEIDVTFIFFFWFIVLGLLMLGLFTRFATIVNYIFGVIIFSSAIRFEYHIFYAYVGINFLLIFMPVSRVFSIDSLIQKLKYSRVGFVHEVDRKILEINYLIPVFSAIALVYFDSIFQKLSSPMWRSGLGMWLPSSLPMVTWNDTSIILNQEWLMKFLGYFVIVFESVFIFLFWFKSLRVPLMIIGIVFHVGILIVYPIPWFAITLIVVYLLMLPEAFWFKISTLLKSKSQGYTFYYDALCPLCLKVVVVIKHLDVFNRIKCLSVQDHASMEKYFSDISEDELLINIHGVSRHGKVYVGYNAYTQLFKHFIYTYPLSLLMMLPGISTIGKNLYKHIAGERLTQRCTEENCPLPIFAVPPNETQDILVKGWNKVNITKRFWKVVIISMLMIQGLIILISPTITKYIRKTYLSYSLPASIYLESKTTLKNYFGIVYHPVFMDEHFKNYKSIYKINYVDEQNQEVNIPLFDNNGLCHGYLSGVNWIYFTFRVAAPWIIKPYYLERGVSPYLRYYVINNKIKSSEIKFRIYVKEIDIPHQWEKDFLHKQMRKPWKLVGECLLKNNVAEYKWNEGIHQVY